MRPRRVLLVLGLLTFAIFLLITGHMDLDWQLVTYRYDSIQNTWDYWEYCPFLRVDWWTAYLIQIVRIGLGWYILGAITTFIAVKLLGDSS